MQNQGLQSIAISKDKDITERQRTCVICQYFKLVVASARVPIVLDTIHRLLFRFYIWLKLGYPTSTTFSLSHVLLCITSLLIQTCFMTILKCFKTQIHTKRLNGYAVLSSRDKYSESYCNTPVVVVVVREQKVKVFVNSYNFYIWMVVTLLV